MASLRRWRWLAMRASPWVSPHLWVLGSGLLGVVWATSSVATVPTAFATRGASNVPKIEAVGLAESAVIERQVSLPETKRVVLGSTPARASRGIASPGTPSTGRRDSSDADAVRAAQDSRREPPASPDDAFERELAIVRDATTAMADGDVARALTLVDVYAARFPSGAFVDLQVALRIDALCHLGKIDEAQRERSSFMQRFPTSAAAPCVKSMCSEPAMRTL